MKWLALGVLFQILVDAVVGVRLLRLATRTRRLPEACLGVSTLLLGVFGYPVAIAARRGLGGSPEADGALLALGLALQNVACLALWIATWRVFRPEERSAALLVVVAIALLVVSVPGQAWSLGFADARSAGVFYWLGFAGRALAFVWSAAEAFRFWRMLRRRESLGLADPVVTDRFRLWAIFCTAVAVGFGVFALAKLAGVNPGESAAVLAVTSAVGLVSGASLWMAFLPPRAYLDRVRSRTQVDAPARPA